VGGGRERVVVGKGLEHLVERFVGGAKSNL